MKSFVGVTDNKWFDFLSSIPDIDEVNFWQPSGTSVFRALNPGEPFLFKLRSPLNYIVGGGFFAHSMKALIEKHRRSGPSSVDYQIGCILLEQPFFLNREDWIPAPKDWKPNIVKGKTYDTSTVIGRELWDAVQLQVRTRNDYRVEPPVTEGQGRYGKPTLVIPRLGRGSFRVFVTDVYGRRCAVTRERT
ncbi:MAG: HNH endonuclease, partial [Deltaproteobacteria bacterium]|nr:HNH endonuclease [Deltaproteobacteria bacterium]